VCKGTGQDTAWPTALTAAREAEIRKRADLGRSLDPHFDAVGKDYAALLAEIDRLRTRHERPGRPTIITLCGSTRFIDDFREQYARLTDEGVIVLSVGRVVPQSEQRLGSARKQVLDELHLRKIDVSDEIRVLNLCGYVGPSSRNEVRYALAHGKGVVWLLPDRIPKEFGGTEPDDVVAPEWHDHEGAEGAEQSWCQDPKCPDRGRE
jgi:hypothetical protein